MTQAKHIEAAKRRVRQEQDDLELMVGDRLDAMSDQELVAILKLRNEFAARRFETKGRNSVPRVTLLRAVYHS